MTLTTLDTEVATEQLMASCLFLWMGHMWSANAHHACTRLYAQELKSKVCETEIHQHTSKWPWSAWLPRNRTKRHCQRVISTQPASPPSLCPTSLTPHTLTLTSPTPQILQFFQVRSLHSSWALNFPLALQHLELVLTNNVNLLQAIVILPARYFDHSAWPLV